MYDIHIKIGSVGIAVTVGCMTFYTSNIDKAMFEINRYITNPDKLLAEYQEKYRVGTTPGASVAPPSDGEAERMAQLASREAPSGGWRLVEPGAVEIVRRVE